jgi:nitrogen-specific signal transduction histidine kinase
MFIHHLKNRALIILLVLITSLVIFLLLGKSITDDSKYKMANQLAQSIRLALVIGDLRQATLSIQTAAKENFVLVSWKRSKAHEHILLESNSQWRSHLTRYFEIPIYYDDQFKNIAGYVVFYFDFAAPLKTSLFAWMVFVGLLFIFILYEQKRSYKILNLMIKLKNEESLSRIATQVAHDIKSPLSALDTIVKDLSLLPEDKRILTRHAISRIHEIANGLLRKNKEIIAQSPMCPQKTTNESKKLILLSSAIENIINEKRILYHFRPEVEIDHEQNASSYGIFIHADVVELRRALSNLINNAVEAIAGKGSVKVQVRKIDSDTVEISIADNGKGMPQNIVEKLGTRGFTFEKSNGNGLGLAQVKDFASASDGQLIIESTVGQGTEIKILIPAALSPEWFIPEINLENIDQIIILDDDPSIHQVWKGRFDTFGQIPRLHLTDGNLASQWIEQKTVKLCLFLFDYELLHQELSGLSIIKKYNIATQSILVTSRYEDHDVVSQCKDLNLKIVPKELAAIVPLKTTQISKVESILIDDDPLIHLVWKNSAKERGITLQTFFDLRSFLDAEIDPSSTVYIDSHLSEDLKGEEVAKELVTAGHENVWLTTGYEKNHFQNMPWLKGILDKTPPWI